MRLLISYVATLSLPASLTTLRLTDIGLIEVVKHNIAKASFRTLRFAGKQV